MKSLHVTAVATAVALVLGSGAVSAKGGLSEEELARMEVMVVTASGFEQKLTDAPASVSVISREELQNRPYSGLADALRDLEGIDVGAGQDKNGNISVTMRGLPANYTLILIDGRRQSDVGNIGPNNFGNSQFMYMPPLEAIERIEVVRGPMSTLYGADAIGGVINIITRRNLDTFHGSVTAGATVQQDSQYGDDSNLDVYLTGPLIKDRLSMSLYGSIFTRGDSEPGYEDELPLPDGSTWSDSGSFGDRKVVGAKIWNSGVNLTFTPAEAHDFILSYDVARQRYDNTEGQVGTLDAPESLWRASNGSVQPRVGYTPHQRVEREQLVLSHIGRWEHATTTTQITRSTSENLGRSLPLNVTERAGVQAMWDQAVEDQGVNRPELTDEIRAQLEADFLPRPLRALSIENLIVDTKAESQLGAHFFVIGAQYFDADMEDGVFGMYGQGTEEGVVQRHRQWAVFAEDNWDILPDLTLTYGSRYDNHQVFGSQLSPRLYLTQRVGADWTFKGGVSTGYKTPEPNQLFPGIVGFGGQGVFPMVGSPHLQPETSINYEAAAYYDNGYNFNANLTVFYNDFEDKIIRQDDLPNCEVVSSDERCVDIGEGWADLGYTRFSQSQNIDKAVTQGVEVAGRYAFTDAWSLRANYTYTDSEVRSGADAGLPLVNTPSHMFNSNLRWQATENFSLSLLAEVRGERFRGIANVAGPQGPEAQKLYYKPYELLHLAAQYRFSDNLRFNARINNLLDEDLSSRTCLLAESESEYQCSADYNTTERARSFWASVNYQF
ncbi:TonB-dependent receptor [Aliidiomarina minuta]|uniref:TonB-dependent receptor n=1 Tax=Aliidiomarina minuta TaxID=880057 RepID=A0A432W3W8_9GAMM|nr:TonB-dependent receptor [Aliidiomarina minuta]RUO23969.1 TonB-dependent receptor [Aliidiomarina minuta]